MHICQVGDSRQFGISNFVQSECAIYKIKVENYISLERGVYRPDSTYKTAKMIRQKYSH